MYCNLCTLHWCIRCMLQPISDVPTISLLPFTEVDLLSPLHAWRAGSIVRMIVWSYIRLHWDVSCALGHMHSKHISVVIQVLQNDDFTAYSHDSDKWAVFLAGICEYLLRCTNDGLELCRVMSCYSCTLSHLQMHSMQTAVVEQMHVAAYITWHVLHTVAATHTVERSLGVCAWRACSHVWMMVLESYRATS